MNDNLAITKPNVHKSEHKTKSNIKQGPRSPEGKVITQNNCLQQNNINNTEKS